jgi:hypothetical protein
MGAESKSRYIDDEVKKMTAYHEGGHALVALYTEGAMPLHKVTCVPRGHALGVVSTAYSCGQSPLCKVWNEPLILYWWTDISASGERPLVSFA